MSGPRSGWHGLCGPCWQDANPTEYLPQRPRDTDACEGCGDFAMLYGHRGPFTVIYPPQDREGYPPADLYQQPKEARS